MLTARLPIAAALLLFAPDAHAAASDWYHVEGGSVRVVTTGMPDEQGLVRGALEIRLKPGWKTYWRDPGSSGVPPALDVSVGDEKAAVDIDFPAPSRFDDGYGPWAGYDEPVALALTFRLPPGVEAKAHVAASAFLGVCETICIPVQAQLELDPYEDTQNPEHAAVVAAAFAALPGPARPGFGAHAQDVEDGAILVETQLPPGVEALDLFVAGSDTVMFGTPERIAGSSGSARFRIPVLQGTEESSGQEFSYTLATGSGAVTGALRLP